MVFIETPVFTKQVKELLSDEEYSRFQRHLTLDPYAGNVIKGTGGLRKIRWSAEGRGKRGGVRVIYFHVTDEHQCRLLLVYPKNVQDDLTDAQKKTLRKLNENW
jgi:mRNA-degrading endonuclease RelE of RelBE toxin-antitoxin system